MLLMSLLFTILLKFYSFFNLVEIRPSTNNACLLIVVAGLFFWEDVDRGVERDHYRGAAVPRGRDSSEACPRHGRHRGRIHATTPTQIQILIMKQMTI
jgi:hypothetical protein